MKRWIGVAALALSVAACKAPQPRGAAPESLSLEALAAAVAAYARRSDLETDSKIRDRLAADAGRYSQACLERAPQAAPCLYYHAIALGLDVRAHPLHASTALKSMLDALAAADATDPAYDEAGPARVKALVLIRAPGWPLGPGDPDAGLVSARRAVSLRPQYPPNVLALAEALGKTGDIRGARETYQLARDLTQALPPTPDRDDWLRQAKQALAR